MSGVQPEGIAAANLLDALGAEVILSDRAPFETLDLNGSIHG